MLVMNDKKNVFIEYLKKLNLYNEDIQASFEAFFEELIDFNQQINLFSRKMDLEDVWILHFLDSISIYEVFSDWQGKKVLDFGTGGGLPGIPIKIVDSDCEMYFLDSVKKKIDTIKKMTTNLNISNVEFLPYRVEDKIMNKYQHYFDIIVCRSVKMNYSIKKALEKLLTKEGKIFLFKAKNLDDVDIFDNKKVHTLDLSIEFERRIVEINYG
jgi:16S rRNA (guanine527-N7)-methyltransferase